MSGKRCSFCNKKETKTRKLLEGKDACICNECLSVCSEDLEFKIKQDERKEAFESVSTFLKPHEIKEQLDQYVVGQEEAKKILSVAVYNHYKRTAFPDTVIQKSNILMIGPTGSGKTFIMQTLAAIMNVPIVIVDASSYTSAGYVGSDVESMLAKLYQKAECNLEATEKGIIYIDEIDKIVAKESKGADVNGVGVQQALLKMLEGSEVTVKIGDGLAKKDVDINTKNILFVAGGAFVGLNKSDKNSKENNKIGFKGDYGPEVATSATVQEISQSDIIKYGFIPEFVGRIPVITTLNKLETKELRSILTDTKKSIVYQYIELFKMDDVDLEFDDDALDYVVSVAEKANIGARGLRGVLEKQLYNLMFEIPKRKDIKTLKITKQDLENGAISIK